MSAHPVHYLALVAFALTAPAAFAQVDISGEWAARIHEDQPHRVPGAWPARFDVLPSKTVAHLQFSALPLRQQVRPTSVRRPAAYVGLPCSIAKQVLSGDMDSVIRMIGRNV